MTILQPNATETNAQYTVRSAGSFKNLFVRVVANTLTALSSNTVTFRQNLGPTSQTIDFGTSTGTFEDTTNNVTVAATDEVDYEIKTNAATGSCDISYISNTSTSNTNTYQNLATISIVTPVDFTDNQTRYIQLAGFLANEPTETNTHTTFKYAGTLKNGFVFVTANTVDGNTPVVLRKNATTDGTVSVSITGDTTGAFEDTANTDTITADDEWNWRIIPPTQAGTQTVTINRFSIGLETTNDKFLIASGSTAGTAQGTNLTNYYALGGLAATTTEAGRKLKSRLTFTAKDMQVNITANTFTTLDTNFVFRKDAGNGIVLPVAAATTGIFQDNSETVNIITTSDINWQIVTPNQAGSITFRPIAVWADQTTLSVDQWMPALRPNIYKQYIPEWSKSRKLEASKARENPKYNAWEFLLKLFRKELHKPIYQRYIPQWRKERKEERIRDKPTPKYTTWQWLFNLWKIISPIQPNIYKQHEPEWIKDHKQDKREKRTTPKYDAWFNLIKLLRREIPKPLKVIRKREPVNKPNPKHELSQWLFDLFKIPIYVGKQIIKEKEPKLRQWKYDVWSVLIQVVVEVPLISHVWNLYKSYIPEWNRKRKLERSRVTPTPKYTLWEFLFNLFRKDIVEPLKVIVKREPINRPNPKYEQWENLIRLLKIYLVKPTPYIVKRDPILRPNPLFTAWQVVIQIVVAARIVIKGMKRIMRI